jgi:hypothetical protein
MARRAPVSSRVADPATLILIHGAWHGAWCWKRLTPLLESHDIRVIAPDLPSMGDDPTAASDVTLESWARFVADIVERERNCVLVATVVAAPSSAAPPSSHPMRYGDWSTCRPIFHRRRERRRGGAPRHGLAGCAQHDPGQTRDHVHIAA